MPEKGRQAREDAEQRLLARLNNSTKYRLGHAILNNAVWQSIEVLNGEFREEIDELEASHHNWGFTVIDEQKWLFLGVEIPLKHGGYAKWTFAFDCNTSSTLAFMIELLRTKRLGVIFRNRGIQTITDPSPAESLVEDHGDMLIKALPNMRTQIRKFRKRIRNQDGSP